MIRRATALALPALLAACTGAPTPRPATVPAPASLPTTGLERVMRQDARALTALFGPAALDVREGAARKLQWRGPACVLDAYLYPSASGGEPTVSWTDARTPIGADMDRASCIAALARAPASTHTGIRR